MDAYERTVIPGIYERACLGERTAIRVLQTLTTERRRQPLCPCGCGGHVRNGHKYASRICVNKMRREKARRYLPMETKPGQKMICLTERQHDVLKLRAEGHNLWSVAGVLEITRKSAEFHWRRVQEKIGTMDTALLTQWALKHGIANWKV